MANQTISVDTNHDALTGRGAGENITTNTGAVLTIDSMPHLTPMGILGIITCTDGEVRIDGSRTYEVEYSSGTGALPAVLDAISWNGGADTGKVVRLNAGVAAAGTLTLTMDAGSTPPAAADSFVSGGWAATCDASKIGYLIVYGEDSNWVAIDARSTFTVTGDWYEVGLGDGTDNQVFTLPHEGHQPAVWVETGSGTGVFQIWHRINVSGSAAYSDPDDFGNTFESGFVFSQVVGTSTLTFYNSVNGGVPPSGARIRIPNVHLGTTTLATPDTEINTAVLNDYIRVVPPLVSVNVFVDHMNGSSVSFEMRGTSTTVVTDSCWGLGVSGNTVNNVNADVLIDNCYFGPGCAANYAVGPLTTPGILDNTGGLTLRNVVVCAGSAGSNAAALSVTTSANVFYEGVVKLVVPRQDENTTRCNLTIVSNFRAETLIMIGCYLNATSGCVGLEIDELIYGHVPGRGTTEPNATMAAYFTGSSDVTVRSGRLATGGAKHSEGQLYYVVDSNNVRIYNHGEITAKIDGEGKITYVVNTNGVCSNLKLKRLWYDNISGISAINTMNAASDILIENCSGSYAKEIEIDASRALMKGMHGASGSVDTGTGVEGDMNNVVGTCFLDYFKSDTTGALGLLFNDRGTFHLADVEITSGTPIWNGIGDLLMRTAGDQVVYTWPYSIKGHTGFANLAHEEDVVGGGTYTFEYDLDTGSGFSGSWTTISGANLSAETISPAGFGFKVRITCTASASDSAISGFAVLTTTTLADQAANFYPLETYTLTVNGLKNPSEVRVYDAANPLVELDGQEVITGGTFSLEIDSVAYPLVNVAVVSLGYKNLRFTDVAITDDVTLSVQQQRDRQYGNP